MKGSRWFLVFYMNTIKTGKRKRGVKLLNFYLRYTFLFFELESWQIYWLKMDQKIMNALKEKQLNENQFYGKKTIISDANLFSSIDYELYDNKKGKVFASMRNILTQKRQQCKVKKDKKARVAHTFGVLCTFLEYISCILNISQFSFYYVYLGK